MAIKEFVSLEGVDEVLGQLKDLQAGGESSAKAISDIGGGEGLAPVTVNIQQATQAFGEHARSVNGVTEAYHILSPLLRQAGLSFGELRGFAVLARGGLDGIAAAVIGSLAVALGSLSEDTAQAQKTLENFFGSATTGKKVFDDLANSAGTLGTTVKAQLPALLSFIQAFQDAAEKSKTFKFVALDPADLPDATNVDKLAKAFGTFQEVLRAGGATAAETTAAIAKFSAEMDRTGTVTGQMVKQLLAIAPGALPLLEQAFGKTGESAAKFVAELDKSPQPIKRFAEGLDQIKSAADKAFETRAPEAFLENLKASLAGFQTALQTGIIDPINKIKDTSQNAATVFSDLTAGGTTFFEGFGGAAALAKAALQGVVDSIGSLAAALANIDWKSAFVALIQAGVAAEQAVVDGFNALVASLKGVTWQGVFDGLLSAAQTVFQAIQTAWQALIAFINSNRPNLSVGGGSTGGGFEVPSGGAAAGGLVSGPGSGTSDSILARLSNFEYVMRAAAVKFYGVDFMHALNAMRLPKDFFRGFNFGGLVLPPFPSPPRFAQGGLAMAGSGGMRVFAFTVDGPSTVKIRASSGVVDELERAADVHNLSRIGRAPGWVR